jgi:Bifunctional DNA primase/polymerase, N-terminal
MTHPLLEAALAYAARGWRVLPIQPRDKIPITAHGKDDATTDETTICTWWRQFPNANVGVATGAASGIVVLDVDAGRGGLEALARLGSEGRQLPVTLTSLTGGGGRHLLFEHPGRPVSNRSNIAPGLDVRGDGGYIVAAPSVHKTGKRYMWLDENAPIAVLPPWLLSLICREPKTASMPTQRQPENRQNAYVEAALRDELEQLARTVEGDRNNQLNKSAFALGQFIGAGLLDRGRIEAELTRVALAIGLNPREIQSSIRSGIEDGIREPRGARSTRRRPGWQLWYSHDRGAGGRARTHG